MNDQLKLIFIISLSAIAIGIVVVLIFNTRKSNINKDIDELNVRFNAIKTVPLAFKLNKAQAMAKRNDNTVDAVKTYYQKYEDAQKHIDEIGEKIESIEDLIASKDYSSARKLIDEVKESIAESENEVADIDRFLEQFSEEESDQRESSAKLKERFRDLKLYITKNSNNLSIANEGLDHKIEAIEDLFSQSEEFMYMNDYINSQERLDKIEKSIAELQTNLTKLPTLISNTKGVIPTLLDEVSRQYALSRQRGVYTAHLGVDDKLSRIQSIINEDVKTLTKAEIGNIEEHNKLFKSELKNILDDISKENKDFQDLKQSIDEVNNNIDELKKLHNYVSAAYIKDKERFGLEDIEGFLDAKQKAINDYQTSQIAISADVADNSLPASEIKKSIEGLLERTKEDIKSLAQHKAKFDKNTTDEQRAKTQLMKLQVVLNEVEVKVLEYHLPAIANSYHDDLVSGRKRIAKIKALLNEVPLDIDELNATLDEAIDYIYKFYNNVNNVVGMAIMVENAIVYGNKYRSSYPEVERDLSKAEFSYLNGEYTKALTMAISCMEKLFPNKTNTSYLENA